MIKSLPLVFRLCLFAFLIGLSNQLQAQYCTNNLHGNTCTAGAGGDISNFSITNGTINNSSSVCPANTVPYEDFSATYTDSLTQNVSYTFSVTTVGGDIISIWIDYDQSGTFDSTEWTQVTTSSTANTATSVSITIPTTSNTGWTGLRVRSRLAGNQNGAPDACLTFYSGATHDYSVYIKGGTPCSGAPTAGTTSCNIKAACPNDQLVLSISGSNPYGGITYQWQSSPDSITWTDIAGATKTKYYTTQSSATYYRCYLVCTNTNDADTSTKIFVDQNGPTSCYCIPTYSTGTGQGDYIAYVEINTLKNTTTGASSPYYTYYSGSPTTTLKPGSKYIVKVGPGTFASNNCIALFIDANADGDFDDKGEKLGQKSGMTANTKDTFLVVIPSGMTVSKTRIRFREVYNNTSIDACSAATYGEVEDYDVDIDLLNYDLQAYAIINPPSSGCVANNNDITLRIKSLGTKSVSFSGNTLTVTANVTGNNPGSYSTTVTSGTMNKGDSLDVTITNSANLPYGTNSTITCKLSLSIDQNSKNDSIQVTTSLGTTPINYSENFDGSASMPANVTASGFTVTANRGNVNLSGNPTNSISTFLNYGSYADAIFPVVGALTSKTILQFDYLLTDANGNGASLAGKDSLNVWLSTDCGNSWSLFESFNSSNYNASPTYTIYTNSLAAYSGDAVMLRLSAYGSGNGWYLDLDNVKIGEPPVVNLGPDTSTCNASITLDAGNKGASYLWNTGATSQTITVTTSGVYGVLVMDSKGFFATDSVSLTFYATPTVSLGNNQTICQGSSVTLDAGNWPANYTFVWNTGATTQTITTSTAGTYWVKVYTPGGCFGTSSVTITVNQAPTGITVKKGTQFGGSFNQGTSTNPDAVCLNNQVEYEVTPPTGYTNADFGTKWTISATSAATAGGITPVGSISSSTPGATNFDVLYTPDAQDVGQTFIFSATIKDLTTGCETTIERYVTVNDIPKPALGSDQTVCIGYNATLDPGKFSSYLWSDGSTGQKLVTSVVGTYWVKVTNAAGCENYDTIEVKNYPGVAVNLGSDGGICPGTTITLDAGNSFIKFKWSTGETTQKLDVTQPGTYMIEATNANGCIAYDTITFTTLPKPTAKFSYNWAGGRTYDFDASASYPTGISYSWAFGDGGTSTLVNPSHTYSSYNYVRAILTVTNSDGCSDTTSYGIKVGTSRNSGLADITSGLITYNAYPNPFSGQTTLTYSLEKNALVSITLFDITGKELGTVYAGQQSQGDHQQLIDTRKFGTAQGIYMLRLTVDGESQTIRLVDLGQ